jgi:hypothetical protein
MSEMGTMVTLLLPTLQLPTLQSLLVSTLSLFLQHSTTGKAHKKSLVIQHDQHHDHHRYQRYQCYQCYLQCRR